MSFHVLGPAETAGDGQVMGGDIKWCLYIYIDIVPSLGGLNEVIYRNMSQRLEIRFYISYTMKGSNHFYHADYNLWYIYIYLLVYAGQLIM